MMNSTFCMDEFHVKGICGRKGTPCQRYGLNSSIALPVLVSARMDHTGREWRACLLVRTLCSFVCCNQNLSRGRQDNNFDDLSLGNVKVQRIKV